MRISVTKDNPGRVRDLSCGIHPGCLPSTEVTRISWRYLDLPAGARVHEQEILP
jgi:hypothetical protein